MAGSYTLPQVRVFQEFRRAPNDVTQNLNPFVVGPCYQLMRYADEGERAGCAHAAYTGTAKDIDWAEGYAQSVPDTSWYSVTMANAYVALGAALSPKACLDAASGLGTKFEFTLSSGKSLIGTDASKLQFPVAVKPGDYLAYQSNGKWEFTKIRDISCGKLTSTEITHKPIKNKANGANVDASWTVTLTDYTGEQPAHIILTVVGNKMTWSSDVAGLSQTTPQALAANTAVTLQLGIKITPKAAIPNGDYVLDIVLVEPYSRDTVTVSDFIPSTTSSFTFVRHVDAADVVPAGVSPRDGGVTVSASAEVDIGLSTTFRVLSAEAYLNQRNLRKDHTDGVYTLYSDTDIFQELGAWVPENPLAYAAHIMLLNSARSIRYTAVDSDDAAGFAKALERASLTTDVYAFCPLTEDADIIDAVVADCVRLSKPEEKSWRIAFFSKPTEESTDVTPNVYGVPELCKVNNKTLVCYSSADSNTKSSVSRFTETVRVGDTVIVMTTPGVAVETTVAVVNSNDTLTLKDPVGSATAACRFTILHKRGRAEYVEAIAATSAAFKNRRAYNVFPNRLRASDGNYVSGMYAAAAVCALACSVAPQQPITNVEIHGFSDLSDVYSKFNRDELNTIAAGGTLILMQDKIGGTVYVRHQISTAYSDGDLNSTELSLVKNLDSISYYFANRFAPYIGRYNISDDLLTEVRGILADGLAHLETTTEVDKLIGPQVLAEGTEVRSLYRDPDEKDKVYSDLALNLPAPFNNFDLHLQVI